MKLTVFHDGQFWVGIVEDTDGKRLRACRHLFGAEPQDGEILAFVQREMNELLDAVSQGVTVQPLPVRKVNPKRLARLAAEELRRTGVSTVAQAAIQLELEARKKARRQDSRQRTEEQKERIRQIKARKAKEKHRGR